MGAALLQGVAGELPAEAYFALAERAPAAMAIVIHQRIRYANPALAQLTGHSRHTLQTMALNDLVACHDGDGRSAAPRRPAGAKPQEIGCLRRDGSVFPALLWRQCAAFDGLAAELVTLQDMSDVQRDRHVAQQRAQLLAQTEELALSGACEYDVATGLVTQSAGMFRIFGEAVVDRPVSGEWLIERVPAGEQEFVRAILGGVRPGMPCEFEHRIVRADGQLRTVLHRSMAEADALGQSASIIGILQDITAQRAAEQQRDRLAQCDSVTGLQNRSSLLDHLDNTLRHARRNERQVALLLIQIDQFRLVSDSLGLAGGDRLLAAVGDRLSGSITAKDVLAHLGGGQYAVLPCRREGVDEALATAVAHAIVAGFARPFLIDGTEVDVTCGIGVSLFPRDSDRAEKLLDDAQAAALRAHELGDNQVCIYAPNAHGKAARRLALQAGLRRALANDEFELHYQPQVDLATGQLVGVEALLRWTDASGQPVSPAEFIPLAEETGLILPIGDWVLRTACAQNLAWQRAGLPPLRVAVNLSMRQLQQPDIAHRVQSVLLETGLDAQWLGIEITENVLMGESSHVAAMLQAMKAMGVEISLDDFGTGYSNLAYLSQLPIDVVKIDRSFVNDITAPAHGVSMTRAVITMAHSLHMKVLAEGVESEGQLSLLVAHHCDQMQGWFFSRAVDAKAIAAMLRDGRALPEHLLRQRERPRTLLLVDDDADIVDCLKLLLHRAGYRVITASSGAEGLQRLAGQEVDVIVSDQRMPGMSGVEFLRRARQLYPYTVRMVLSGDTELHSITEAINEGAIYKFLTKPWDNELLRIHIDEAFRHKEMADENRRLASEVMVANQQLSDVNLRLQLLLQNQREQVGREEARLVAAHEVLACIPTPLIGIDADGMIAYVNADAEALFAEGPGILGCDAATALPESLRPVWLESDGSYHDVCIGTRRLQAVCSPLRDGARGSLMVLTPCAAAR